MSAHITFDSSGAPLSGYLKGGAIVMSASGYTPGADDPKKPAGQVTPSTLEALNTASPWVNWGADNDYPRKAIADFRQNGVMSTALKLKAQMLYGKNVVVCQVVGYDKDAKKEIVEIIDDPEINEFLERSNIANFRNRCIQDYVQLGMIFPMFLLNESRDKISMVVHDKAAKFRFAPFDESKGRIDKVFRSANWPNPSEAQREEIPCIDSYMHYLEVDRVRFEENIFKYVFPIQSYDLLNDYYAVTILEAIRKNGWLENSTNIPAIVKSMIKNVMSLKYHIKIPLSYWTAQYPDFMKKTDAEREAIVSAKMQEMNDFLSGKDNQMKAFISHYATDKVTGKEVAGWEIIHLEDKAKYDAWNGVASTANAEILFAVGINPVMFGLNSPGGDYKGGGSDIRESWLIMVASAQGDRDLIYSWWPFVRKYNGYNPKAELRTIDQVLTTLDQGKGTQKTLS